MAAFETPLDYCLLALIRLATDFVESDGVIMAYGLWAVAMLQLAIADCRLLFAVAVRDFPIKLA